MLTLLVVAGLACLGLIAALGAFAGKILLATRRAMRNREILHGPGFDRVDRAVRKCCDSTADRVVLIVSDVRHGIAVGIRRDKNGPELTWSSTKLPVTLVLNDLKKVAVEFPGALGEPFASRDIARAVPIDPALLPDVVRSLFQGRYKVEGQDGFAVTYVEDGVGVSSA